MLAIIAEDDDSMQFTGKFRPATDHYTPSCTILVIDAMDCNGAGTKKKTGPASPNELVRRRVADNDERSEASSDEEAMLAGHSKSAASLPEEDVAHAHIKPIRRHRARICYALHTKVHPSSEQLTLLQKVLSVEVLFSDGFPPVAHARGREWLRVIT